MQTFYVYTASHPNAVVIHTMSNIEVTFVKGGNKICMNEVQN